MPMKVILGGALYQRRSTWQAEKAQGTEVAPPSFFFVSSFAFFSSLFRTELHLIELNGWFFFLTHHGKAKAVSSYKCTTLRKTYVWPVTCMASYIGHAYGKFSPLLFSDPIQTGRFSLFLVFRLRNNLARGLCEKVSIANRRGSSHVRRGLDR